MGDEMYQNNERSEQDHRTIKVSGKDVEAAGRLLATLLPDTAVPALERLLLHGTTERGEPLEREELDAFKLVAVAREEFRRRRRRSNFFDDNMFGEPAWDMLLALYVNHLGGERLTVSRLMRFAGAPDTTGLRWLAYLERRGLVGRENHPNDGRSFLVYLTEKARQSMDMYFSDTLRSPG